MAGDINVADPVSDPDEDGYVAGDINRTGPSGTARTVTPPPAADPLGSAAGLNETAAETIARLEADLTKARKEAGNARVNAKTAAADEARKELTQQLGVALGIIEPENLDPAKLTEQIAVKTAEANRDKLALAVYLAADAAGGDPAALLDSRAFLDKVAALDHADAAALTAAITEAVAANPRLGKVGAPVPPAVPGLRPNPAQGSSASQPLDLTAQIAAAERPDSGISLKERMVLKAQLAANKK